jgi:hypothetical protein
MKEFFGLGFIALWIAAIVGWIMNIVVLYGMSFDQITGPLVLRIVGIFVAPLGSILGLFF